MDKNKTNRYRVVENQYCQAGLPTVIIAMLDNILIAALHGVGAAGEQGKDNGQQKDTRPFRRHLRYFGFYTHTLM